MHRIPVGVLGASGYAGRELCTLVAGHPQFELIFATANERRGDRLVLPSGDIMFVPGSFDDDEAFDKLHNTLDDLCSSHGIKGNAAFYLSIPPKMFPTVLEQMERNGKITAAQRAEAQAQPLTAVDGPSTAVRNVGGYYMEEVRRTLIQQFGENADRGPNSVYAGGLWVRTAYDPTMQRAAETALRDGLRRYEGWVEAKRSGAIGYTVRVVPHHPQLANQAEMGLATLPADLPTPPSAEPV